MSAPRLIVGLGNPGPDYERTRHNAGFWLAERLARRLGVSLRHESRFHGIVGRDGDRWILLPQTYMNRSGHAVAALARFYRIDPAEMVVFHDELDLPPGSVRLKWAGGLGGHNGLKDITAHLGTQDYWRLRIGIGHPGDRNQVVSYVLKPARAEEQSLIDAAVDRALDAWDLIASGEYSRAQQKLHTTPGAAEKSIPDSSTKP